MVVAMFDHLGDYIDLWLTCGRFAVLCIFVIGVCGALALWRKI